MQQEKKSCLLRRLEPPTDITACSSCLIVLDNRSWSSPLLDHFVCMVDGSCSLASRSCIEFSQDPNLLTVQEWRNRERWLSLVKL